MKSSLPRLAALLLLPALTGCRLGARGNPVPSDWYQLPETGGLSHPGNLDELGSTVERFFKVHSRALEPFSPAQATAQDKAAKPVDWVPWHLAVVSSDFAITGSGVLGALLFEGSAAVQANWLRPDPSLKADTVAAPARHSDLVIHGSATPKELERQLEPSIQAALSNGTVRDEAALRRNVLGAALQFQAIAQRLASLPLRDAASQEHFPVTGFRLEASFGSQGQFTPIFGAGATVNLRFDWIVDDADRDKSDGFSKALAASPVGDGLEAFVRSITPDLEAAFADTAAIRAAGFKLSAVRVGLGMSAQYEFGISQSQASMLGSIVFGDNDDEGGCFDPDGDGDCHNHRDLLALKDDSAPAETDDGGIALIGAEPPAQHLDLARSEGVDYKLADATPSGPRKVVYRIRHAKFRAGLRKALGIASFFTRHASAAHTGSWKIKELETEFDLSLTGTFGMTTVGGTGELELEFENTRF